MVLAIDPLTPSTVYAGTEAGVVFRTADAGRTWIGTGVTNQSATFSDVLGSVLGKTNDFGAIGITSNTSGLDDIFSVTSTPGFGGTFGLTIPAVPFSGMLFDPIPFFGYPSDSTPCIREGDGFPSRALFGKGRALTFGGLS